MSEIGRLSNELQEPAELGRTPEWAVAAVSARAAEWSSDRVVDPGDSHDKGEASLCVGEAA